jgi:ABC-type sugar transport system permease subunit
MLGGADALGYGVGVAARPRARRRAWLREARPWLYLAPALLLYGLFWIGPAAYSLYLSFFDSRRRSAGARREPARGAGGRLKPGQTRPSAATRA